MSRQREKFQKNFHVREIEEKLLKLYFEKLWREIFYVI